MNTPSANGDQQMSESIEREWTVPLRRRFVGAGEVGLCSAVPHILYYHPSRCNNCIQVEFNGI